MSKMDGLRAMREARYERSLTQATLRGGTPAESGTRAEPLRPPAEPSVSARSADADATTAEVESQCGHRAISGRTCTRERDHAAKSHRYS